MRRAAWMSAVAIVWLSGGAARAEGSDLEHAFSLSGPLSPDATVELGGRAGPVVLEEVLVQDAPTDEDVAGAGIGRSIRPKPVLVVTNGGSGEVKLHLEPANGRIPLGLQVGPLRFLELVVQKVSTDRAANAARPAEEVVEPSVLAVVSHHGEDEASMHLMLTFLDEQGQPVLTCVRGAEQDEQTLAETHAICRSVRATMGAWSRVTQARFAATVVED